MKGTYIGMFCTKIISHNKFKPYFVPKPLEMIKVNLLLSIQGADIFFLSGKSLSYPDENLLHTDCVHIKTFYIFNYRKAKSLGEDFYN